MISVTAANQPPLPDRAAASDIVVRFAAAYLERGLACRKKGTAGPLVGVVFYGGGEYFTASVADCRVLVEVCARRRHSAPVQQWCIETPARAAFESPEAAAAAKGWRFDR